MDTNQHSYDSKKKGVHSTTTPERPLALTVFFLTHELGEELRTVYFDHLADLSRVPAGQVVPHPRTSWSPQVRKKKTPKWLMWPSILSAACNHIWLSSVATYPTVTNNVQQVATNAFQLINYRPHHHEINLIVAIRTVNQSISFTFESFSPAVLDEGHKSSHMWLFCFNF